MIIIERKHSSFNSVAAMAQVARVSLALEVEKMALLIRSSVEILIGTYESNALRAIKLPLLGPMHFGLRSPAGLFLKI